MLILKGIIVGIGKIEKYYIGNEDIIKTLSSL